VTGVSRDYQQVSQQGVTINAVRDKYARSSAKLVISAGVVAAIGLVTYWVQVNEWPANDIAQSGVSTHYLDFGISTAAGVDEARWMVGITIISLTIGLVRQFVWRTMPDGVYRVIIPLAAAELLLLLATWRHIASYQRGFGTFFQLTNLNASTSIGLGFWLVLGAQFAQLYAGVKVNLFYEKDPLGRIQRFQTHRAYKKRHREIAG